MKVKIKLSNGGQLPKYSKEGDAGMDLTAISYELGDNTNWHHKYGTGISIEIPKGFVGLIFPRSSICKRDLILSNHVGVIDSGFRGEIFFNFKDIDGGHDKYQIGDRIGQLMIIPYPEIEFEEVTELSQSERGANGFGSSGN